MYGMEWTVHNSTSACFEEREGEMESESMRVLDSSDRIMNLKGKHASEEQQGE